MYTLLTRSPLSRIAKRNKNFILFLAEKKSHRSFLSRIRYMIVNTHRVIIYIRVCIIELISNAAVVNLKDADKNTPRVEKFEVRNDWWIKNK